MIGGISAAAILVFCVGLYTVMVQRHVFKTILGLCLMEGGVLLLLVAGGYVPHGVPPILPLEGPSVNPLPHSFTLTAIVIGASDIALAFAFAVKLHRRFGSVDLDRIRGLKG